MKNKYNILKEWKTSNQAYLDIKIDLSIVLHIKNFLLKVCANLFSKYFLTTVAVSHNNLYLKYIQLKNSGRNSFGGNNMSRSRSINLEKFSRERKLFCNLYI